jgi:hypothetical protein
MTNLPNLRLALKSCRQRKWVEEMFGDRKHHSVYHKQTHLHDSSLSQSEKRPEWRTRLLALSAKGWWRKAGSLQVQEAMPSTWFEELGLINLTKHYAKLNQ